MIERLSHLVEPGHAQFAGPGDVGGAQVEGQTHQVVVQCPGDEFVDAIALLAGHAAQHFTGGLLRGQLCYACRAVLAQEGQRVEEGLNQAGGVVGPGAVGAEGHPVYRFIKHRVAEAVNRVGKLAENGRIEGGVDTTEEVEVGLDEAGEFLEDAVLILHLHHEAGSLE